MSEYKIQKINKNEYSDIYGSIAIEKLFFASKEYIEICEKYYNNLAYVFYKVKKGNEIIAILAIAKKNIKLIPIYGSPMPGILGPYLGPVFVRNVNESDREKVINAILWELRFLYLDITLPPMFFKGFIKLNKNFRTKCLQFENNTSIVDLSFGEEAVWEGMSGRARTRIRKAIKNNVITDISNEINFLDDFSDMYSMMWEKQRITTYEKKEFFQAINELYAGTDHLLCVKAEKDGVVLGYNIFILNSEIMYSFAMVISKEGRMYEANSLMWWESMKIAVKKGIKKFDVCGTNNSRIGTFKESFGGKKVTSIRYKQVNILLWPFYNLLYLRR